MSDLLVAYRSDGAHLAPDGIPLHFGDPAREFDAALTDSVVFDRSHEGRISLSGADRLDLLNRISTNQLLNLPRDEGRATIFLNANARILDRVVVYNWRDEDVLLAAGPGRGATVARHLRGNIFYNDKASVIEIQDATHQFCVMGPQTTTRLSHLIPVLHGEITATWGEIKGVKVFVGRIKPYSGDAWVLILPKEDAVTVWTALMSVGIIPSGGMVFHALRIRAGEPGVGFELTDAYIPLELGLWDEVSFNKGCYTGQEIIARMESRNKLAKMLVRLAPSESHVPGTPLFYNGKRAGEMTSTVTAPDGNLYAMGVVKLDQAEHGTVLHAQDAEGAKVTVLDALGVQRSR